MSETVETLPAHSELTEENLARVGHEALRETVSESLGLIKQKPETLDSELAQSERTRALTEGISHSLGQAYDQLSAEEPAKIILHDKLLLRARELQEQAILQAKATGELTPQQLEVYLATVGLCSAELEFVHRNISYRWEPSKAEQFKQAAFDKLIEAGLTEDLVTASRSSYGIVVNREVAATSWEDDDVAITTELSGLLDSNVLSAGLGKHVSFNPEEPAYQDMPDYEASESIKKMGLRRSAMVSLIASQQLSKGFTEGPRAAHRRSLASQHCLELIEESQAKQDEGVTGSNQLIVDSLSLLAKADPSLTRNADEEIFASIRQSRQIFSYHRINYQAYMQLDAALGKIIKGEEFSEQAKQIAARMNLEQTEVEKLLEEIPASEIFDQLDKINHLTPAFVQELARRCIEQGSEPESVITSLQYWGFNDIDYADFESEMLSRDPSSLYRYMLSRTAIEGIKSDELVRTKLTDKISQIKQSELGQLISNDGPAKSFARHIWDRLGANQDQMLQEAAVLERDLKTIVEETNLLEIFGPNGAGASFAPQIAELLFKNPGKMVETAEHLSSVFSRDQSLWYLAWQRTYRINKLHNSLKADQLILCICQRQCRPPFSLIGS
jgi:hypothetical protein